MSELIYSLLIAIPFLVAIGIAMALCIGFVGAYGSPVVGVGLIIGVFTLTVSVGDLAFPLGIHVLLPDIVLCLVGAVTLLRVIRGHAQWSDHLTLAWLALGVVWFALFAVGLPLYKSSAGVGFRNYFYLWTAVAYLLTFRITEQQLQRSISVGLTFMLVVCVVVAYRWVRLSLGAHGEFWQEDAASVRVVSSFGAQMLAMGAVVGVAMWTGLARPNWAWTLAALLILPIALLLQHRTVWFAMTASVFFAIGLASWSRRGRWLGAVVPMALGAVAILGAFLLVPQTRMTSGLERSTSTATFIWRVDSWQEMVRDWARGGPKEWPAGRPFGAPVKRYIESQGQVATVSAHSHYVGLLVNGGVLGLTAYLVAQLTALRRLTTAVRDPQSTQRHASDALLALSIVAVMVYAVAYGTDYLQGVFLGLAYSRALQLRRASAPSTVAMPHQPDRKGPKTVPVPGDAASTAAAPGKAVTGGSRLQGIGAVRPM